MSDEIVRQKVSDQFFVHNCFGNFFRGVLDWFADDFYDRFQYKVIGTYDKSVEFFNKKKELGHEVDTNLLPSITLDPILDFSPEERAGRFLWQYRTLAPQLGFRLFQHIDLREQDITITPVYTRYQGTFELIFWMSSVYELLDFRTMLLQYTGGYGRWIRPKYFWSYIILPDEIEQFRNDKNVPIDWGNTDTTIILIDTIKKHKRALPIPLDAIWKLDSFNDNSTKYGADQIAEYKLSAIFTYEVNIPTYMVLNTKVDGTLVLGFSLGKICTKYPLIPPLNILKKAKQHDPNFNQLMNKSLDFFRIKPEQTDNTLIIKFKDECLSYPTKEDFIKWCSITKGKLIKVISGMKYNDVQKGDIIYFEKYSEEFLPFIRKCASVICFQGRVESPIFEKCETLKKSLISDLADEEILKIEENNGKEVTLDVPNKKLYFGLLDIEETKTEDVGGLGYDQLKNLKKIDPDLYDKAMKETDVDNQFKFREYISYTYLQHLKKHLVIDYTDGVDVNFPLKFHAPDVIKNRVQVYIDDDLQIQGTQYQLNNDIIQFMQPPDKGCKIYSTLQVVPIRDVYLIFTYDFTKEDLDRKSDETLDLSIKSKYDETSKFESLYDICLISYGGIMEYLRDYEIDLEKEIAHVKLPAKEGESIYIYRLVVET